MRVGRVNGQFVAFPTQDDLEESDLDLIVSGSEKSVAMIEGFAREMPEDDMDDAMLFAHQVDSRNHAPCSENCSKRSAADQGRLVKRRPTMASDDRLQRTLTTTNSSARQANHRQARSRRSGQGGQSQARWREIIPDPKAEGAIKPERVLDRLA